MRESCASIGKYSSKDHKRRIDACMVVDICQYGQAVRTVDTVSDSMEGVTAQRGTGRH